MDVGIDLTRISRFRNRSMRFINMILTENELVNYNELDESNRPKFLATHWACKEAIYKATQDINYLSYEICKSNNNKPYVLGHEEIKISITHEGDYVTAIAVIF